MFFAVAVVRFVQAAPAQSALALASAEAVSALVPMSGATVHPLYHQVPPLPAPMEPLEKHLIQMSEDLDTMHVNP